MGAKDGAPLLRPSKKYTHSLSSIRNLHPKDGDDPLVAVDISILIVRALKTKDVITEFFMEPPVPVKKVIPYIKSRLDLLRNHKFRPILVFDGQRCPAKADETRKRYQNIPAKTETLGRAYSGQTTLSMDDVLKLRKESTFVREDILYEVVNMAKEEGMPVVGAPFEADHQIVSLAMQGVVDYVFTDDSDLPFIGSPETIMRLSLGGKCCLVSLNDLLNKKMPSQVGSGRPFNLYDMALFSCFLGNDYVHRLANNGVAASKTRMKNWCALSSDKDKGDFIASYVEQLPEPSKFGVAMEMCQHAPVFIVKPNDPDTSARNAFLAGAASFSVLLRSLDNDPESDSVNYWIMDDSTGRNMRVGFIPARALVDGYQEDDEVSYKNLFHMIQWSRTGRELVGIKPQLDSEDRQLCHGSILDFEKVPAKYVPDEALIFWLAVRQIVNSFEDRTALVDMVEHLRQRSPPLQILPAFLLRGGGGYVTFEVLAPRDGDVPIIWRKGDEALETIRSWMVPAISDTYFTTLFKKRNNSRIRCLAHLKGGSYDIRDLKVTTGLKSNINPTLELLVIQAVSAPSQKIKKGLMYSVTIVFAVDKDNNVTVYIRNPVSRCDCANGCWFCAHMGALILILFVIQQRPQWDFKMLLKMLPDPIHSVAAQCIPVSFVFPKRGSEASKFDSKVLKDALKRVNADQLLEEENINDAFDVVNADDDMSIVETGDGNSDDDGEEESDSGNEEEDEEAEADWEDREAEELDKLDHSQVAFDGSDGVKSVPDVSSAPAVPVCKEVTLWLSQMEESVSGSGSAHKISVANIQDASAAVAAPTQDDASREKRRLMRHARLNESVKNNMLSKSMMSLYTELTESQRNARLDQLENVDGDIKYPDYKAA